MAISCSNKGSRDIKNVIEEKESEEILDGAYSQQRDLTEEEFAMFRKVTEECDMALTPLSVSMQVVAGFNYKFWCRFESAAKSGHCWVEIFKPLDEDPELVSIEEE